MFDLRRLRGAGVVLASLAAAMSLVCSTLALSIGRDPLRLLGNDWPTVTQVAYERAGKRVSGVIHRYEAPENRLGVLLGASALECGVDPRVLGPDDEIPLRWLTLNGYGSSAQDLEGMADIVLRSGLRPEVLILAMSPGMLARSETYLSPRDGDEPAAGSSALSRHISTRQWRALALELACIPRGILRSAFPERKRVCFRVRAVAQQTRMKWLRALGFEADVIFAPEAQPWFVDARWADGGHLSEKECAEIVDDWHRRGWLDAHEYSLESAQSQALVRLSQHCQWLKIKQIIVLMPESSALRAQVPHQAERYLSLALRTGLGPDAPAVVNLRDAVPDHRFRDPVHVDPSGREILSAQIRSIVLDELERTRLARR
jgi:hypothetical protein